MTHAPLLQFRDTLEHIIGVTSAKQTAPDKWLGHCPAHGSQRHRDFSIKCTPERILFHCFASCSSEAVCQSLGLAMTDLFLEPRQASPVPSPMVRPKRIDRAKLAFQFELAALDRRVRAENIFKHLPSLDHSTLPNSDLDRLMTIMASAYEDREQAERLETMADILRCRLLQKGAAA